MDYTLTLNHGDVIDIRNVLLRSKSEIAGLRARNEHLEAKVSVLNLVERLLNGNNLCGMAMHEDVRYGIDMLLERIQPPPPQSETAIPGGL